MNLFLKLLLIAMLVFPLAYIAVTLLGGLIDEVLAKSKKDEKTDENGYDDYRRR